MLGGFDGDRQFVQTLSFPVPEGPFRIAVYGSEKREGDREPREFVTRSPLLVGVKETPESRGQGPGARGQ